MHIRICPPDVKCNISISTCTIGWTVILCTSCCAGSCTKLEATKLNPLKRWWALALGGTPGESAGEGIKWPRELHKRWESNSMAPATDKVTPATQQQILLNWQTHVNIIHLHIKAVVCLLHPFPLDLTSTGVLFARISPLGYRGFFHSSCSFSARSPPRERRHRMARLGERRMAQGRAPLWLSRGSPRSGKKLPDAVSVLCSTPWLQKLQRLKCFLGNVVCCVGQENVEKTGPEAGVKAQCSRSGGLQPHKDLSAVALGAGTYSREDAGWLVLRWTK